MTPQVDNTNIEKPEAGGSRFKSSLEEEEIQDQPRAHHENLSG